MRLEIPGIRPAVLSERTYQELDEFRGFRHVVRSLYAYNLDAGRVLALTERLATCSENFTREIRAFCEFLTG